MVGVVLVWLNLDHIGNFRRHGVRKNSWMDGRSQVAELSDGVDDEDERYDGEERDGRGGCRGNCNPLLVLNTNTKPINKLEHLVRRTTVKVLRLRLHIPIFDGGV